MEKKSDPPAADGSWPKDLPDDVDALLKGVAHGRRLQKGELLFAYGSTPDALFGVMQGTLRVSVTSRSGREAVIAMLEPGQWFGEVSLFIDAPRVYDTRALTDCELAVVPAASFHRLIAEHPDVHLHLTRLICRRLRMALEWIDDVMMVPFPVRLARRLLALEHAHGLPTETAVAMKLSQEDLSFMLGVSRQSINRQLKEWERQQILQLKYGRVMIADKATLQRIASDTDA